MPPPPADPSSPSGDHPHPVRPFPAAVRDTISVGVALVPLGVAFGLLVVEAGLMERAEVEKQLRPARLSGIEAVTAAIPIISPEDLPTP